MTSRRAFLLASLLAPAMARAMGSLRFASYPFTLGVASGYPTTDGVALWTRLAPLPLEGGGMPEQPVEVRWEVAEDEAFKRIVRRGREMAVPENAHSVHAEVDGLKPGREYWYRFIAGREESQIARTRTAPEPGKGDERMKVALGSCQQYEQGYFTAHAHMAADDVDLVAFVGDYIYESSWGRDHVRKHHKGQPFTLADYRDRYALYKTDANLQKSHASAPWILTWDDHEVENDYANDRSEKLRANFLDMRAAAYKAFYEHMPLRRSVLLAGGDMRIYGRIDWGRLATFHVLDDRQYRSHQVCPPANQGGSTMVGAACTARLDPTLTMLGEVQEKWLDEGLEKSAAAWNFITQQTIFAPAGRRDQDRNLIHWTDSWDGYPAARERLVRSIAQRKPANPVILGGDIHATIAADIHLDAADPKSPIVASEIVATSITAEGFAAMISGMAQENPHIRYADSEKRGYVLLQIDGKRMEARNRAVATVKSPNADIETAKTVVVESGAPGIK